MNVVDNGTFTLTRQTCQTCWRGRICRRQS